MKNRRDIATLALSTRTRNLLRDRDVKTLGQLLSHSAASLGGLRGFGRASLVGIQAALNREGMELRPQDTVALPGALWYLAAPVSGNVEYNLARASEVLGQLLRAGAPVIAPWISAVKSVGGDSDPALREAGICLSEVTAARCDGIICLGPPTSGMRREINAYLGGGKSRVAVVWDGQDMEGLLRTMRRRGAQ